MALTGSRSSTITPGYYAGGITIAGNGSLTMAPGIYILGGAGLSITGNGSLAAQGVMIFITGAGRLNLAGNGAVTITPPNPAVDTYAGADTYQGISVFVDRTSTAANSITGNANMNIDGVLYMPNSPLTLAGNGGTEGAEIISNTLNVTGNGTITVNRGGGQVYPVPGIPYLAQ